MIRFFLILCLIFLAICDWNLQAQELDLKKNFGWASATIGGKGGRIIRVTNLNKSGQGSFAAALSVKEKRIIVFEVSGVIDLEGNVLNINSPYLTVLGQTAPSPGITIINGEITIMTNDVIMQHLKIRSGSAYKDKNFDGLSTHQGAYNVIIDHCSFTWAVDENLSVSGPRFEGATPAKWRANTSHRITFSNNIIGEGLFHSTHIKGGHSMGTLIHDNVTDVLLMRNLYVSNNERNPLFKGGTRCIFLNNYIFNPGRYAVRYSLVKEEWGNHVEQVGYLTIIGNVVQLGEDSHKDLQFFSAAEGLLNVYFQDNLMIEKTGNISDKLFSGDRSKIVKMKPIWHDDLMVLKTDILRDHISFNVGARPWERDEIDKRIIKDAFNHKGKIIDSEDQVEGFRNMPKGKYSSFDESQWDLNTLKKR